MRRIDVRRQEDSPVPTPGTPLRSLPPQNPQGPLGGHLVMHIASESRPDHWYPIYRRPDGRLFCGCPDFVNRRQRTGEECKHLRHLRLEGRLRSVPVPPAQSLQTIIAPRFLLLDL